MNIIQKNTPNFYSRNGHIPKYIVLHIMDGSIGATDDWFSQSMSQVSAHYGVSEVGEVHQYVDEKMAAWGNGRVYKPTAKVLLEDPGVNPNWLSISIEHEGNDLIEAPDMQKQTTVDLIKAIAGRYNIPIDRDHIIGHYEIYASKPLCPASDKSVIDEIVARAAGRPIPPSFPKLQQQLSLLQQMLNALRRKFGIA